MKFPLPGLLCEAHYAFSSLQGYTLRSRRHSEGDYYRICSSRMASGGWEVYLRQGCTLTMTCRDRAKCSMTSCITSVNFSVESSSGEGHVGRSGDGAGETGRAGGDSGDVRDDDGASGGEFERACDGYGGGGGCGVERTGLPARA
jgi:hypothetical protein